MPLKYKTPEEIEKIGEDIRNNFGISIDDNIDITKLAESLGFNVLEVDFDNKDISGAVFNNLNEKKY